MFNIHYEGKLFDENQLKVKGKELGNLAPS